MDELRMIAPAVGRKIAWQSCHGGTETRRADWLIPSALDES